MKEVNEPQKELDLGQAIVYLEKAVAEKGADYIYEVDGVDVLTFRQNHDVAMSCNYWHRGAPSCIVGHVLDYMGYEPGQVIDGNFVESIEGNTAPSALEYLDIHVDAETKVLLTTVQDLQDQGVPWGEALNAARGLDQ